MNSENRPGRKRQKLDEVISPADMEKREKREKNRQAAQRHREKKDRIMTEQRERNEELKAKNDHLRKSIKEYTHKVETYKSYIKYHQERGCTIPDQIQEMWENCSTATAVSNENSEEEGYQTGVILEGNSSIPASPDSTFSEIMSPNVQSGVSESCRGDSVAPTAMFSGVPLAKSATFVSMNSSSSSRSPAPSTAGYTQTLSPSSNGHKDLFQLLTKSPTIPAVLAPISKALFQHCKFVLTEDLMKPNNDLGASEIPNGLLNGVSRTHFVNALHSHHNTETATLPINNAFYEILEIMESQKEDNCIEMDQNTPSLEYNPVIAEGYSYSEELHK